MASKRVQASASLAASCRAYLTLGVLRIDVMEHARHGAPDAFRSDQRICLSVPRLPMAPISSRFCCDGLARGQQSQEDDRG
jgi:hypothetical protein